MTVDSGSGGLGQYMPRSFKSFFATVYMSKPEQPTLTQYSNITITIIVQVSVYLDIKASDFG